MLNKKIARTISGLALGVAALVSLSVSNQALAAKGSGGGRTFDIAYSLNGACKGSAGLAVDAIPRIVLRSSQGVIYYILETIGTASAGTWSVAFTTQFNNSSAPATVTTVLKDFPQGWAIVGGQLPGGAKFANLAVESKNIATGVSCSATLYKAF